MYSGFSSRHLATLLIVVAAPLQLASAATVVWTGATSTDFNLGSNWTGGNAPTGADLARFDALTARRPTVTANTSVDRLTFNIATGGWTIGGSGKQITINASGGTSIDASATHSGTNTIDTDIYANAASGYVLVGSGGTLVFNGALNGASTAGIKAGNAPANNGTVVLNASSTGFSGTYSVNYGDTVIGADNVFGAGTFALNSTGRIIANGSRSLTSGIIFQQAGIINLTGTLTNSGNVTLTSASQAGAGQRTVNVNGSLTLSGAVINGANSGTGAGLTVNSSGTSAGTLTLSGNNTYTGSTVVSNGTLLINGDQSSATGNVTIASAATLGGVGTVGGATTISGDLAAGSNGVGLLSFSNGLTLNGTAESLFQINGLTRGTEFDAINITGALAYNGVLTLDFGFDAEVGQTFNLFDFTSRTGDFTSLNFLDSDYSGTFDAASGVLTLTSVPEPGVTALLLGAGLTLLVIRRRRSVVKG